MSVGIDQFFRLLRFLRDNPETETLDSFEEKQLIYPDDYSVYEKSVKWDPIHSLSFPKDVKWAETALRARKDNKSLWENVLAPGSFAYNTGDMALMRNFLIEWGASSKAFSDMMRRASDIFTLDDEDVDRAIRSFGVSFFNKKSVSNIFQRQSFLANLTELYKIKGSPSSILRSLEFVAIRNAILREYWVELHPYSQGELRVRGTATHRNIQDFDPDTRSYTNLGDSSHYNDTFLTWTNFMQKLADIGDPHWWYTEEEILAVQYDPDTWIDLPSLTPYFGIEYIVDIKKYDTLMGILEKIMSDQLNSIISGNVDLIPREIGVSGFNEDLSEKDIWIEGYDDPLSLLEVYLGFAYSQIRAEEYLVWKHLHDFLVERHVDFAGDEYGVDALTYTYPWAVQELIYWIHKNSSVLIDGVLPLSALIETYILPKSNYYLSEHELETWWVDNHLDDDPAPTTSTGSINWGTSTFSSGPVDNYVRGTITPTLPHSRSHTVTVTPVFTAAEDQYDWDYRVIYVYLNDVLVHHQTDTANIIPVEFTFEVDADLIPANDITEFVVHTVGDLGIGNTEMLAFSLSIDSYQSAPSLFYQAPFNHLLTKIDTEKDRILFYNGGRDVDFKSSSFEYQTAIDDLERLWNIRLARVSYDGTYRLTKPSNATPVIGASMDAVRNEWIETYYSYTSNPSPTYLDTTTYTDSNLVAWQSTHDGRLITPLYDGKYPTPNQWNWGVASDETTGYLFLTYEPNKWIRIVGESNWTAGEGLFDWDGISPIVDDTSDAIGYEIADDTYLYKYSTTNIWLRFPLDRDWDYCDAPITPEGIIKKNSPLLEGRVIAKVSEEIAALYLNEGSSLAGVNFTTTFDPLSDSQSYKEFDQDDLETYLSNNYAIMDQRGYIIKDFNTFIHEDHLYKRVLDVGGDYVWIRLDYQTDWAAPSGNMNSAIYEGNYKNPNLDLVNRYDAERILRGEYALTLADLPSTADDGDEILVAQGADGYPETWIYSGAGWAKNPSNRVNDIQLGVNDNFINWIDGKVERSAAGDDSEYEAISNLLLQTVSSYVRLRFDEQELDIAAIYKTMGNSGINKELIDFFKPKRARLLAFSVVIEIDDRINNSIILADEFPGDRLTQQLHTYLPHDDSLMHANDKGTYNRVYLESEVSYATGHPTDSLFYMFGFVDTNMNGYYYRRTDLDTTWLSDVHINMHNMILAKSTNNEAIDGRDDQWILGYRDESLDFCTCTLYNVDTSFEQTEWIDKTTDLVVAGTIKSVDDVLDSEIVHWHQEHTTPSYSDLNTEHHWNEDHPRQEDPRTSLRKFETAINTWGTGYVKFDINKRKIFPLLGSDIMGTPENMAGGRVTAFDVDGRNAGNVEFHHAMVSAPYPYISQDIDLRIRGGVTPVLSRAPLGNEYISDSHYNSLLVSVPSLWWSDAGFETARWESGPVHHRPVFLGEREAIHECYPNKKPGCCDYYDTGCEHDGEQSTNYNYPTWDSVGETWDESWVAEHQDKEVFYDVVTKHYSFEGTVSDGNGGFLTGPGYVTDPTSITYFEGEESRALEVRPYGDTWCNECDQPTYTPDLTVHTIPSEMRDAGIFHDVITGQEFSTGNINEVWYSFSGGSPVTMTNYNPETDLPYGYVNTTANYEVYLRSINGIYFWELRDVATGTPQLQTKFRKTIDILKRDDLEDLYDDMEDNYGNFLFKSRASNFLNSNDIDIVEEEWFTPLADSVVDVDAVQTPAAGLFQTSQWIETANMTAVSSGESDIIDAIISKGTYGDLDYHDGNLYICTDKDIDSDPTTRGWKRIPAIDNWYGHGSSSSSMGSGFIPEPDSPPNYFKYYLRDDDLYLFVDTVNYHGWVRIPITRITRTNYAHITGEWNLDFSGTSAAERLVFDSSDYPTNEFDGDQLTICESMLPYEETFDGRYALIRHPFGKRFQCKGQVWDDVTIEVYEYIVDGGGDYIQISWNVDSDPGTGSYYEGTSPPTGSTRVGVNNYRRDLVISDNWY